MVVVSVGSLKGTIVYITLIYSTYYSIKAIIRHEIKVLTQLVQFKCTYNYYLFLFRFG